MSAVLLDASSKQSQVPAVYAETLNCGTGGVVAGSDPSVGVRFSRQYGALGATTELLAGIYKDLNAPAAPTGEVGGTLSVAGLRFGNINSVATVGTNAGTKVCGICKLVGGTVTVQAAGVNLSSPTNLSLIFLTRLDQSTSTALGHISLGTQTPGSFTVNALDPATPGTLAAPGLVAADVSFVYWMMINPLFS